MVNMEDKKWNENDLWYDWTRATTWHAMAAGRKDEVMSMLSHVTTAVEPIRAQRIWLNCK